MVNTEGIQKSEANLKTILEHADTGYALYNAGLQLIAYNALAQKFSQLLYKKELAEGNHLLYYFPAERHPALLATAEKVLKGEKVCYEVCFEIDHSELWLEVRWLHVKNAENKNWGFILTSKDITESKLAAVKLEKMTRDLLARNKALEQFGNIVSHNLKAPVANILSIAELMDTAADDEKKMYLDFIKSSSQALTKVITDMNQILEIRQHLHEAKERVYFDPLMEEIKNSINYLIITKNVIIWTDFEDTPFINCIRSFLYSIFYNLILNSIKYGRDRIPPEIEVSAKTFGKSMVLRFKDNGKGINLTRHGNDLFGLYKRFDNSVEGSGLGLFMIKTQIEQLDGTINVESIVGEGTTFIIELPV